MTTTIKTFTLHGRDAFLPREWLEAVNAPSHVQQGEAIIFALRKSDVAALLTDRGAGQRTADLLSKASRQHRGVLSDGWRRLVDAGIIDPDQVGVYAAYNMVKGSIVARIDLDGVARPVARFDYDYTTRGLSVEAI